MKICAFICIIMHAFECKIQKCVISIVIILVIMLLQPDCTFIQCDLETYST